MFFMPGFKNQPLQSQSVAIGASLKSSLLCTEEPVLKNKIVSFPSLSWTYSFTLLLFQFAGSSWSWLALWGCEFEPWVMQHAYIITNRAPWQALPDLARFRGVSTLTKLAPRVWMTKRPLWGSPVFWCTFWIFTRAHIHVNESKQVWSITGLVRKTLYD